MKLQVQAFLRRLLLPTITHAFSEFDLRQALCNAHLWHKLGCLMSNHTSEQLDLSVQSACSRLYVTASPVQVAAAFLTTFSPYSPSFTLFHHHSPSFTIFHHIYHLYTTFSPYSPNFHHVACRGCSQAR